jgi:hypothetical protein
MDLAATCAALLHLMGLGREGAEAQARPAEHDPADMGTAYGLEASLAPNPESSRPTESQTGFQASPQHAWLWPH